MARLGSILPIDKNHERACNTVPNKAHCRNGNHKNANLQGVLVAAAPPAVNAAIAFNLSSVPSCKHLPLLVLSALKLRAA